MKSLLSLVFLFTVTAQSFPNFQETETLKATFVEFADDTYYFTDKEGFSIEFQQIEKSVLDAYNLNDDSLVGKNFVITYNTDTEEDEEGDDIQVNNISALKLVE